MSEPNPPKATADDILAALYALLAAVEAFEEWHHVDHPLDVSEFHEDEAESGAETYVA